MRSTYRFICLAIVVTATLLVHRVGLAETSRVLVQPTVGIADRIVLVHPNIASFFSISMDVAENGSIYLAVQVTEAPHGPQIRVYRSDDGGDTWTLWGTRSDGDGVLNTGYFEPSIHVALGNQNRVYLAYRTSAAPNPIVVVYSSTAVANAVWTVRTAMTQVGVGFSHPQLTSDAVENAGYRVFLTAQGNDGNGDDIWVTRSLDFGNSWEAEYTIAAVATNDRDYHEPSIAYASGGRLHCAWHYTSRTAAFDASIRTRRALSYANAGATDWGGITDLALGDGNSDYFANVAASHAGSKVMIGWSILNNGSSKARLSVDGGATWPIDSVATYPGRSELTIVSNPADLGFVSTFESGLQVMTDRLSFDAPLFSNAPDVLADRPIPDGTLQRNGFDWSSTLFGSAVAWNTAYAAGDDTLFFDAEWRGHAAFPSYAPGFPLAIASPAVSPPAVVNLDEDSQLEIVYGDAIGNIRVLDPDGTPVPGWPIDIGNFPVEGPIAIADLDGDSHKEIVAGSSTGLVFAYRKNGSALPGFPKNLGTGTGVYCSIGAIVGTSKAQIVACSSNRVYVISPDGSVPAPFPVFTNVASTIKSVAAIGDVDGDGQNEIVVLAADNVRVIEPNGTVPMLRTLAGKTFANAPSLGDLDLNGDLEIVVPTEQGNVYVMHHNGLDYPGGWPYTIASGLPVTSVALAEVRGGFAPELVFAAELNATVYVVQTNTANLTGWPQTTAGGFFLLGMPTVESPGTFKTVFIGSQYPQSYGWSSNGVDQIGWPKTLGAACELSAASGDVDNDGDLEIVYTTASSLVILDLPGAILPNAGIDRWPMYGYGPERNFCLACAGAIATDVALDPGAGVLRLAAPAPNPSAGLTRFSFEMVGAGDANLTLFDAAGRAVRTLLNTRLGPGLHQVAWDGRSGSGSTLPNGLYFARLSVEGERGRAEATRRLTVMH